MKKVSSFLTTVFAAMALMLGVLLPTGVAAQSQPLPALDQLVKNAAAAMLPAEPYHVVVMQTVQPRADGKAPAAAATRDQVVQRFTLAWNPATGLATMPADAEAASAAGVSSGASSGAQVSVRTDRLLADLLNHPQINLVMEGLNGRMCYKITARSPEGTGCTVWIDAERWYVPAADVFIKNVLFAQVTIEYQRQNGLWLPSMIVIEHAGDGTRIIQTFGNYSFGAMPSVEKAAKAAAVTDESAKASDPGPSKAAVRGAAPIVQPHGSLNALLGFPAYSLDTGWVGAGVGPVGAHLRVGGAIGGTLAQVSMNGQGDFVPACLRGTGDLWFQAGTGSATMDFGVETWAQYNITIDMPWPIPDVNTTGNLPIIPNVDLRFSDQASTTSYLLGDRVTLSDSFADRQLVDYGFDISGIAGVGVGASLSANCSNEIEGRRLQTSAGTFTAEGQSMSIPLSGSSLTIGGIVETYRSTLTFSLTPNARFHISVVILLDYDVNIPIVTLPIRIPSSEFSSSPARSITFDTCPAAQAFTPMKATYNGLFADTKAVSHKSSGRFVLTTTANGKFSGKLQLGSSRSSVSGQLDANGHARVTAKRSGQSPLTVEFQMGTASGGDQLAGIVSDGVWVSDLYADRAVFNGKASLAPQMGQYTLVVPANCTNVTEPNGDSWASVTVDKTGRVRLTGSLADGTKISQAAVVSRSGAWPLYVPLHNGQGSIVSWMAFATNTTSEDLCGDLTWTEPAQAKSTCYPAGFVAQKTVSGARYVRPGSGENVLKLANGDLILSGGSLKQTITNHIAIGAKNLVTDTGGGKLNLKFTTTTGLFKGSIANPDASKPIPFAGAVLQKRNMAVGFFQSANGYGRVVLQGH